jgi:hypothetical protein
MQKKTNQIIWPCSYQKEIFIILIKFADKILIFHAKKNVIHVEKKIWLRGNNIVPPL